MATSSGASRDVTPVDRPVGVRRLSDAFVVVGVGVGFVADRRAAGHGWPTAATTATRPSLVAAETSAPMRAGRELAGGQPRRATAAIVIDAAAGPELVAQGLADRQVIAIAPLGSLADGPSRWEASPVPGLGPRAPGPHRGPARCCRRRSTAGCPWRRSVRATTGSRSVGSCPVRPGSSTSVTWRPRPCACGPAAALADNPEVTAWRRLARGPAVGSGRRAAAQRARHLLGAATSCTSPASPRSTARTTSAHPLRIVEIDRIDDRSRLRGRLGPLADRGLPRCPAPGVPADERRDQPGALRRHHAARDLPGGRVGSWSVTRA